MKEGKNKGEVLVQNKEWTKERMQKKIKKEKNDMIR